MTGQGYAGSSDAAALPQPPAETRTEWGVVWQTTFIAHRSREAAVHDVDENWQLVSRTVIYGPWTKEAQ